MPAKPCQSDQIARGAQILRDGGLVAFPTETVYGLGADATNGKAVARIFEVKKRPQFNPLIVHLRSLDEACEHGILNERAKILAQQFWPGPLTLVVPRAPGTPISELVSAGLGSVALRVPAHKLAQDLLQMTDRPIAAPSANRSGTISPTTAAHVRASLGGAVDLILDDGPSLWGLESTVVGFKNENVVLLRSGAIARGDIEMSVGPVWRSSESKIQAPGQLASHYAPRATLRLNATSVEPDEALLGFGVPLLRSAVLTENLSTAGDLREAASNLFAMLHRLDDSGVGRIAVMPIPSEGLGEAINDRLTRAAAPRGLP